MIVANSVKLVIETYVDLQEGSKLAAAFDWIDRVFTAVFSLEALLKILRSGLFVAKNSYLKDSWSVLDITIVATSLADLIVENIQLPFLRILRLLRILRPLRFISQNKSMRIVVNALGSSMVAIMNVLIVIGMVWVMFSILGTNLMKGKLGRCVWSAGEFDYYGVNRTDCVEKFGGVWSNFDSNFDNIANGLVSLFILSTLEGWPFILGASLDANDPEVGPVFNSSPVNGLFFIFFILVGRLLLTQARCFS